MSASKGYYCVVQYCPDLSRGEAANIGVLLFCPSLQFIQARMSRGNDRIRRFFGRQPLDRERIKALKASIQDRLEVDGPNFKTLDDLEKFIQTRANDVQITPPRPMKVFEPEKDLRQLFGRLVGGRTLAAARKRLEHWLFRVFTEKGVETYLRKHVEVRVPVFQRTMMVPFGFQNGRFNLIQPVRFQGVTRENTEARASLFAIEGRSLYAEPNQSLGSMQLVVVAEFAQVQPSERLVVQAILEANHVKYYQVDRIDELVNEIRTTANRTPHTSMEGEASD